MERTRAAGAQDELVDDSGWRYLSRLARDDAEDAHAGAAQGAGGGREQEPELSPEEIRAMRTWLDSPERRDWLSRPEDEDEDQQREDDPSLDEFAWRERELPSIWRNDPLSVPRTSALPRGGRNFRLPSSFSSSSSSAAAAAAAASPSTFSPSNPPPLAPVPSAYTIEQHQRPLASSNQNPRGIDLRTARVPRVYEPLNSSFSTLRLPPHVQAALRDSPAARRARETNAYAEEVQAGRSSRLRRGSESGAESLGYSSSSDDDEGEGEENGASNERQGVDYVEVNGLRFRGLLRRSEAPEVPASERVQSDTERMADLTRAGEAFFSSIPGRDRTRPVAQVRNLHRTQNEDDSDSQEDRTEDPLAVFTNVSRTSAHRRRTREETNSLMGAALRSKKPVWLLYCGDDGSFGGGGDRLPAGFRSGGNSDGAGEGKGGGGCGALVCSRALLDGVPDKVFFDVPLPEDHEDEDEEGQEYPAASSDLPPRADRVADLERDGTGDWVGVRGSKKCGGCVTRDVACTRCGNILGYRLLKPCVRCSIPRPTYTTYASAVTNDPASPTTTTTNNSSSSGNPRPTLTAGGVTGGGVVDGLLFHFRLGAVTPVMRRVGIPPKEELPPLGERLVDEARGAEASGVDVGDRDGEEDERANTRVTERHRRRALASLTTRMREPIPRVGERMLWKHIPSAQRDFLSGLVGEPSDWISPTSETWWLDHAIVKHSRKRSAGAAFANSNRYFNPDSLSSAHTSTEQSGGISRTSPANSPLRSSLSRSHAIRMRVPLSNAHPASALATAGGGGSETAAATTLYDRYRHDASDFARRVRQRYADPSASDSAVVTSLERAGYGSGFAEEESEEGGGAAGSFRLQRGREAVGR